LVVFLPRRSTHVAGTVPVLWRWRVPCGSGAISCPGRCGCRFLLLIVGRRPRMFCAGFAGAPPAVVMPGRPRAAAHEGRRGASAEPLGDRNSGPRAARACRGRWHQVGRPLSRPSRSRRSHRDLPTSGTGASSLAGEGVSATNPSLPPLPKMSPRGCHRASVIPGNNFFSRRRPTVWRGLRRRSCRHRAAHLGGGGFAVSTTLISAVGIIWASEIRHVRRCRVGGSSKQDSSSPQTQSARIGLRARCNIGPRQMTAPLPR